MIRTWNIAWGIVAVCFALMSTGGARADADCTVVSFDVRGGESRLDDDERERLGTVVRSVLRTKLPVDDFVLLTEQNVYALLPPGAEIEDCLADCAIEAGRSLGASYAVTTDVTWSSGRFDLVVSLYETASANLLEMTSEWMRTVPDIEMALERIARDVAARIREDRARDDPSGFPGKQ